MTVTLTKEQEAWLEQQVKDGVLPSVEDGLRAAVADMMHVGEGDLSWARPYLDAGRRDVVAGNVSDGDEVIAWLRNEATS